MKLGFVFDTRFKKYNEEYYSTNLSVEILTKRYLTTFDEMVVIGRYKEIHDCPVGKLGKSNAHNIEFKCISDEKPLIRVLNFKKDNQYIESVLKECDAVICRGWRGTQICRKLGKPYLVEVVNCAWDSYWNHGILGKIVAPIMYTIRKFTTWNASHVIYVTNKFLQKRYPTKGKTAFISDVALEELSDEVLEKRLNKIRLKNEDEKIIIGTAAAVNVPFKGQRFVIKALAKLKKEGLDNYEYQIVGSGDDSKLRELAKKLEVENQVVFLGSYSHDRMFEWYDSIDIYIQPSLQEGLPRAVIEAMSRGLVCYGTCTGGIPELLDKDCVCSSNRFIADKIVKMIKGYNPKLAKKIAMRNFEESKKYAADILEAKRYDFLCDFRKSVGETSVKNTKFED